MLDVATGALEIQSLPIRIGSRFTRQQFLSSALAEHARILVQNEPYCSFSAGSYELAGLSLSISLWFYGEQLESIALFHDAKALGPSWSDWSKEKERQRKQIHDQWLLALTGHASHVYAWGEIWSTSIQNQAAAPSSSSFPGKGNRGVVHRRTRHGLKRICFVCTSWR